MANSKDKDQFVNPFKEGVTYAIFVSAIGRKSVRNYCKGHLSESEIDWIEEEVKNYKKNK